MSTLLDKDGTVRTFGSDGWIRSITDRNGNTVTIVRRRTRMTIWIGWRREKIRSTGRRVTQYDVTGNLTTFTDRKNQVTTIQFDSLNRRTQVAYADATTTFAYDTAGRLVKASDTGPGAGSIEFAYDILDRLIQETTPQGTVAYQYDVLGRRTQMAANGQQPTLYQYDAASRLTRVEQGALYTALSYDHANRRTSLSYSNNTTTSYAYDLASRLTGITHNGPSGVIEALTYAYDPAGNRVSLTRGNGTASLVPNAVASATYDAANEQTTFAGTTLTYDANGNLTNDGVNTYHWDARNRLVGINGNVTASFQYDALGRRTQKTLSTPSSALSTSYLYDGNDIAAEIGGGAVGANYLRSLNIDEPFVRQSVAGVAYYHTDALGSSLVLTNPQGSTGVAYSYEPFGKTTVSGASASPFQFTGRENDGTGLYHYRARYYSTNLQRFISSDPIGLHGGDINFYAYVGNNPTTFIDLDGLAKDRTRRPNQQGGSGPLTGDDDVVKNAREISRKEGGGKGAEHITKEMERLEREGRLSEKRAKILRGARKLLRELGEKAKTVTKIGGLGIGMLLELADPAEAGQGSDILPGEAGSSRKK